MSFFEWGVGIKIEDINIEDNSDMIEQNQEEYNESIDIRDDSIDQAIVTDDDLDTSLFNNQGSNIDQNNDNISLSSIDEDTSIIYEDIDKDISKDTEINKEDEELQDNKTYALTEALKLENHDESDYDANGNNKHSSIHQSQMKTLASKMNSQKNIQLF